MTDPSTSPYDEEAPQPDAAASAAPGEPAPPEDGAALAGEALLSDEDIAAFQADMDAAAAGEGTDPEAADELTVVTAERDEYLDALQRIKAEFDNHRRRVSEQAVVQREQAAANLVEKLLPVLDACEAALAHDTEGVRPINDQLLEALGAQGLSAVTPTGESFDPEQHEAVLHEEGDGDADGPVVAEVLRTGYAWNGRVIRPAMVKVRG